MNMNPRFSFQTGLLALALAVLPVRANITPNPLFADNAVLQQGMTVPVWGAAAPGERVTVEFSGQSLSTTADAAGKWQVCLTPLKASTEPHTLTISGKNKIVLTNILVGEVWICSGQSNMERQLGLRDGQKPITDWQKEAADAKYPEIRQFYVPQTRAFAPAQTVPGSWAVCSPETVTNFTAVGYFFGRDLYQARHVPIGLIHSSWGGTVAEAWISEAALNRLPDFANGLAEMKHLAADPAGVQRETQVQQDAWYARVDPGTKASPAWSATDLDTGSWKTMKLPTHWEDAGYPDFDGVFWFRRTFDLPGNWDGSDVELHLGAVDDNDTTWVNGVEVGATMGWNVPRIYRVSGTGLKHTNNVIAVRVLDTGGNGGIWGGADPMMRLVVNVGGQTNSIPLTGEWLCRQSVSMAETGWPPGDLEPEPQCVHGALQRHDRAAPALCHARRHLVSRRGERGPRTAIPHAVSRADRRLASGMGRRQLPVPVRSACAIQRQYAGTPRGAVVDLATYDQRGDGRDD